MASLNKVLIIGNLGKDPEVTYTPKGTAVAKFSVATKDSYKSKDGNKTESTDWHNIVIWGKLAEICGEYLHKGSQVYVEGKLKTRSWEGKDGQKKYIIEVVAEAVQFLDKAGGQAAKESTPQKSQPIQGPGYIPDDDIPF